MLRAESQVLSYMPNDNWTPFWAGRLGLSSYDPMTQTELIRRGFANGTAEEIINTAEGITDALLNASGDKKLNTFAAGDNQTEKTKQEKWMESLTTDVSTIAEQIGYWSEIVDYLVRGIAGLFATWIGGKIVGRRYWKRNFKFSW